MTASLLTALQLADSGFPSGAFVYSWGLEAAAEAGQVTRASFPDWIAAEMIGRWANFDRIVLSAAFDHDLLAHDAEVDTLFWAEALRVKSAEAGQSFLAAMARLEDPVAIEFRDATLDGRAHGHLPVAQGGVFQSMGLSLDLALAASAHSASQSLASAGVRLGIVGALEAQRIVADLQPELAGFVTPPPPGTLPSTFAPISELAMLHPSKTRLFAN